MRRGEGNGFRAFLPSNHSASRSWKERCYDVENYLLVVRMIGNLLLAMRKSGVAQPGHALAM